MVSLCSVQRCLYMFPTGHRCQFDVYSMSVQPTFTDVKIRFIQPVCAQWVLCVKDQYPLGKVNSLPHIAGLCTVGSLFLLVAIGQFLITENENQHCLVLESLW